MVLALRLLICFAITVLLAHFFKWWRLESERSLKPLNDAWAHVQAELGSPRYIRGSTSQSLKAALYSARPPLVRLGSFLFANVGKAWEPCAVALGRWNDFIAERNAAFVEKQLKTNARWFDTACGVPLTQTQREAAVKDDDRVRIIAGAGTGKTSTVLAKTLYLLEHQGVAPENILLLAFNKNAAEEIRVRLIKAGHSSVATHTFHALGLDALAREKGSKPSLHPLGDPQDPGALQRWIGEEIDDLLADPLRRQDVLVFLATYLYPFRPRTDFESEAEFITHIANLRLRTFKGEAVKSFGELAIANFLFFNGIPYQYEAKYHIETATVERRQYKPDFYLPEQQIYIEYFGTDRNGNTADHVNKSDYAAGMTWKRELHKTHGSKLIELFSYNLFENNLERQLANELTTQGVELKPINSEDLEAMPQKSKSILRLASLSATYLSLFKSNHYGSPIESISPSGDFRHVAFLKIFVPIYRKYQELLAKEDDVDFNDMIGRAAGAISNGHGPKNLTHVIVDEFQDLSQGRKQILDALLETNPGANLFCVGDDWQSIYRFAGSDIGMMTEFHDRFGPGLTMMLSETFRYSTELIKVSGDFIQKNPNQLKKSLISNFYLGGPAVIMTRQEPNCVQGILDLISATNPNASVLLLGRYNDDLPSFSPKKLKVRFMTVHKSKGLEADYVVILNGAGGLKGFPSEISTDPILTALYPSADDDQYAEERRLFYVALTRARKKVYYVVDPGMPSKFAEEISKMKFVDGFSRLAPSRCPNCKSGELVNRQGPYGDFWGCSNFPVCEHTENKGRSATHRSTKGLS